MKLTFKPGRQDKIHIYLDDEYKMTVDRTFVENAGLYQEMELTEQELADLSESVSFRRAFNKAVDLLSRREHSVREIKEKLRLKGYGDYADAVIEELTDLDLISDERFAELYTAELLNVKHYGKRRIIQELYRKGISREIIDDITAEIESDEDALDALILRKYGYCLDDEKGIRRTINGMLRLGYSYSEIKSSIDRLKEDDDLW